MAVAAAVTPAEPAVATAAHADDTAAAGASKWVSPEVHDADSRVQRYRS